MVFYYGSLRRLRQLWEELYTCLILFQSWYRMVDEILDWEVRGF